MKAVEFVKELTIINSSFALNNSTALQQLKII
jgi:hypothetical protein